MEATVNSFGSIYEDQNQSSISTFARALSVLKLAASRGREWENEWQGWELVDLQIDDVKASLANPWLGKPRTSMEFGQLLLTVINVGRWYGLSIEESLNMAIERQRNQCI